MKITIYELLGLIKDGKAPKKIAYIPLDGCKYIFKYDEERKNYFDGENFLRDDCYRIFQNLNDQIEIIEEEKALEKLTYENTFKDNSDLKIKEILVNKINELIDEINKLKEVKC